MKFRELLEKDTIGSVYKEVQKMRRGNKFSSLKDMLDFIDKFNLTDEQKKKVEKKVG